MFLHRRLAATWQQKEARKAQIQHVYENSHQLYGAPKITHILQQQGIRIAERTVGVYMKELGIRARWVKPWIATTCHSDFSTQLRNLLQQQFAPVHPNTVWCTDITYIWTQQGFVYLTCIMDLFSRKIIAWTLSRSLAVTAVVSTIQKALAIRPCKPQIIHSDRGSQFVSQAYIQATQGIQRSYSRKAYPYDNACIESFHALLKREWLNQYTILDYGHAHRLVFEYIEAFYNTIRIHSHCNYVSPQEYEKQYNKTKVLPTTA